MRANRTTDTWESLAVVVSVVVYFENSCDNVRVYCLRGNNQSAQQSAAVVARLKGKDRFKWSHPLT